MATSPLEASFELKQVEKWEDPYDSIILKLVTIITYIIGVFSSAILLLFVVYETRGYAGHYRTIINQLLSVWHGAVRANISKISLLILQVVQTSWAWC